MHRTLLIILVTLLAGCGARPPEADLLIPINVRCSTCTDYIRCDRISTSPAVYDPAFNLYVLQPKGPGYEITSITEYFLQFVEPKTSYARPLAVHAQTVSESGQTGRHTSLDHTATIDVTAHRIELSDGWIDQTNGEWHDKDGALQGGCRTLDRQEGGQTVSRFAEQTQ